MLGIVAIGAHKPSTKSIGRVTLLWAIFAALALVTIVTAPHFKRWGKNPSVIAFVDGTTAATAVPWKFKKIPEPVVVLAAALIGLGIYPLVHA